MNFRLTIYLACVAALLGAWVFLWDRDEEGSQRRLEEARRAFRFDAARVTRIIFEQDQNTIECRLEGRHWMMTSPIAARADAVAIEQILSTLQDLSRGEVILPPRRAADPYGPYGLEPPKAQIMVVEGTATNHIWIGRRTPLGDGVYVRRAGYPGLTRVSTTLLDLLPANANALRERTLLTGGTASINRFDLRNRFGYIQLARLPSGQWRMFQPVSTRADASILAALLDQLLSCRIIQFVQDNVSDWAPYGLDSQGTTTVVLNDTAGAGSQMISFGDPLPNAPELVYARLRAENSVYAVPASIAEVLTLAPDALRDRRIPGLADPAAIQRVFIAEGEQLLEFHREADGSWWLDQPLYEAADAWAVQTLLHSWSASRITAFEPAVAAAPSNGSAPATRTIRLTTRGEEQETVQFRLTENPGKAGTLRLFVDDETTAAIVSPSTLLDFPLDSNLYRNRIVLAVPSDDIARIQLETAGQTIRIDHDQARGEWLNPPPWLDDLLAALNNLQAEAVLPARPPQARKTPALTLHINRRGKQAIATTLYLYAPDIATLRGRDVFYTLSPETLAALFPEALQEKPAPAQPPAAMPPSPPPPTPPPAQP